MHQRDVLFYNNRRQLQHYVKSSPSSSPSRPSPRDRMADLRIEHWRNHLWADGVHVVPLLGSAVIGLVVVLCLFLAGIAKRIHARLRVAVQVLPMSTPFPVQVLLRYLPRAIRFVCIPVLLLSITGRKLPGLLGLLCGVQLLFIGNLRRTSCMGVGACLEI